MLTPVTNDQPATQSDRDDAELDPVTVVIRTPNDDAQAQGVVAHFDAIFTDLDDVAATGDVARGPSGLAVTRIEISATAPGGVTARVLRNIPVGRVLRNVQAGLVSPLGVAGNAPRTSGRTQITGDLLRDVAVAYLVETGPGKDRRAIQRLAERFDRPEGTVRGWVARARQEGWLGPGSKGRMGAEPGPKLLNLPVGRPGGPTASSLIDLLLKKLGGTTKAQVFPAMLNADRQPEQQVGRELGVPPVYAAALAFAIWGRSPSEEMERRQLTGEDPNDAMKSLTDELANVLHDAGIKTPDPE